MKWAASENGAGRPLRCVEQQRKDAGERAGHARNVGGANVAAAGFAHICLGE